MLNFDLYFKIEAVGFVLMCNFVLLLEFEAVDETHRLA